MTVPDPWTIAGLQVDEVDQWSVEFRLTASTDSSRPAPTCEPPLVRKHRSEDRTGGSGEYTHVTSKSLEGSGGGGAEFAGVSWIIELSVEEVLEVM